MVIKSINLHFNRKKIKRQIFLKGKPQLLMTQKHSKNNNQQYGSLKSQTQNPQTMNQPNVKTEPLAEHFLNN